MDATYRATIRGEVTLCVEDYGMSSESLSCAFIVIHDSWVLFGLVGSRDCMRNEANGMEICRHESRKIRNTFTVGNTISLFHVRVNSKVRQRIYLPLIDELMIRAEFSDG